MEQFEREGKPFSAEEVRKIRGLIMDIREVLDWDWGAFCGNNEDFEFVGKARTAMKDVEELFGLEKMKFWTEFSARDMDESLRLADEYNRKELPAESMTLPLDGVEKLKSDIGAIQDVIEWDIDPGDETGMAMIKEARKSLTELRQILD